MLSSSGWGKSLSKAMLACVFIWFIGWRHVQTSLTCAFNTLFAASIAHLFAAGIVHRLNTEISNMVIRACNIIWVRLNQGKSGPSYCHLWAQIRSGSPLKSNYNWPLQKWPCCIRLANPSKPRFFPTAVPPFSSHALYRTNKRNRLPLLPLSSVYGF